MTNRVRVTALGHEIIDASDLPGPPISTVPALNDPVDHPAHYTSHPSGVECITITEHMSFLIGNVIKYVWRADGKNGVEDLRKARWCLGREIAKRKADQS